MMLENHVENLAILDLRIEALEARIAERRTRNQVPGEFERTLAALLESRRVYTAAILTQAT